MAVPNLSEIDIRNILNDKNIISIELVQRSGQKLVAKVFIENTTYLVKFIQIPNFCIDDLDNDNFDKDDATFGRLRREINILKSCNCESLVQVLSDDLMHTVYNNKHIFYYTEEFINGSDLQTLLNNHYNFSIPDVINFALCINSAIAALWQHSIIHRDIKPQNIILNSIKNNFVLIDPGIAFDLQDISFTQAGSIVGTATFMSPEQLNPNNRRSLDFRSDHFLLGICMYLLLTGIHPFYFGADSIYVVHDNIVRKKHLSLKEVRQDVPIDLSKLIDRLLSKEPHMRYRSTQLLEDELLKIKNRLTNKSEVIV